MAEMAAIAAVAPVMSDAGLERLARGEDMRQRSYHTAPSDMTASYEAMMATAEGS